MNTDVDTELTRENLNNREGQTESKPVDRCYFTRTEKGVRCFPNYQHRVHRLGVFKVTGGCLSVSFKFSLHVT